MMKFYHHTTGTMAQPRKAMKALGFQGCCLRCDAENVSGLKRCKSCIDYHKLVKNMILENDDSILIQHMKNLYAMLSNPEMFDEDGEMIHDDLTYIRPDFRFLHEEEDDDDD